MTLGRLNVTKELFMVWISEADSTLQPKTDHVYGDWRIPMTFFEKVPLVTVRFSPITTWETSYGRRIPEVGAMEIISWSAHVFANACREAGQQRVKYAQELADKIKTKLVEMAKTVAEDPNSYLGVADIFDISMRESEPDRGPKGICRIIIEGRMLVKRTDE